MKFSLATLELLRDAVKFVGRDIEYAAQYATGRENITFYHIIERFYQYNKNSNIRSIRELGIILLSAISTSNQNVTLTNAMLSFYDYFVGTDRYYLYNKVVLEGDGEALDILVMRGAFNNSELLRHIIIQGHARLADKLISSALDLGQYRTGFYDEMLCVSSINNNSDMLVLALDRGADIHKFCLGRHVLIHVVKNNNYESAVTLIESNAIMPENILEYVDDQYADSGVAEYLVLNGANVNCLNKYNISILMSLVSGHQYKAAKLLIDHGANVNAVSGKWTVLSKAINHGDSAEIIEYLIEHGADVNTKSFSTSILEDMIRAPHIPEERKHDIVKMILCNGNYSETEVSTYSDCTKNIEIQELLESYVSNSAEICGYGCAYDMVF